jgi:hypothetical protein
MTGPQTAPPANLGGISNVITASFSTTTTAAALYDIDLA